MASEKICGKVTPEERDEIKALFERKMALGEVFQALTKADPETVEAMYERAVADMGKTSLAFSQWWNRTAQQYGWEGVDGGSWRIDFDTCEVKLVVKG